MRAADTPTFICANCEAEIGAHPVFHVGLPFCCPGCAADGPCICSYDPPGAARMQRRRAEHADEPDEWVDELVEPGIPANPPLRPVVVGTDAPPAGLPAERDALPTLTRS